MLTIRLAVPDDAEALIRLNMAFNEVEDVSPADVRRSLAESGEIVIIAELNAEIIGFCCAQVHHSFCYSAPVAELTEMYVCPTHRRKGAAAGMLRFLETYLQTHYGVDEIHLLTGTANYPAQGAYRHAGFRAKNELLMVKEVKANR